MPLKSLYHITPLAYKRAPPANNGAPPAYNRTPPTYKPAPLKGRSFRGPRVIKLCMHTKPIALLWLTKYTAQFFSPDEHMFPGSFDVPTDRWTDEHRETIELMVKQYILKIRLNHPSWNVKV